MKKSILFTSILFSVFALLRADEGANYTPLSRTVSETFTSKVVKVYSFQEGDSSYVAYVVNWKDHEVIVTPLAFGGAATDTPYKVGDTIRCQIEQMDRKLGDSSKTSMTFFIASTATSSDERLRLDSICA